MDWTIGQLDFLFRLYFIPFSGPVLDHFFGLFSNSSSSTPLWVTKVWLSPLPRDWWTTSHHFLSTNGVPPSPIKWSKKKFQKKWFKKKVQKKWLKKRSKTNGPKNGPSRLVPVPNDIHRLSRIIFQLLHVSLCVDSISVLNLSIFPLSLILSDDRDHGICGP